MAGFFDLEYGGEYAGEVSDPVTIGNDVVPVTTDPPVTPSEGPFTGVQNWLGSLGTIRETARDLGTAVGTIQRDLKGAQGEYTKARTNASTGNAAGQWWAYASPMDKAMLGIAAVGLGLLIWQVARGK